MTDGGTVLNLLAAQFALALGNSRLELAGDGHGISDFWVGLALNPALAARAATGWRPLSLQRKIVGEGCRTSHFWVGLALNPALAARAATGGVR